MSKPNLLLVDDEERVLRTLKSLFRAEYKVFATTDGNEALTIARQNKIHVIVSDQRMPIMTGVEVLRNMKQISPNTMRILLTGYSDLAAIVGSVNEGEIYRYINKPWVPEELERVVKEAAETALSLETLSTSTENRSDTLRAEQPAGAIRQPKMAVAESNGSRPGLLVVDDDKTVYESVKDLFGTRHPVHWANNVEDAFSLLSNEHIAIIITEVSINNEDISTPLKTLKEINPSILTLVLTSFQDTQALIGLINQCQIYRYLPKPVMQEMLERSIQASLSQYQRMQALPQLAKRYKVEKSAEKSGFKLSGNIMGYLKKIRSRSGSRKEQQPA